MELIFAYTPTTSGVHSIEVLSVTGGYVDFFWKPASAGCDPTGWNCIQDVFFPGTYGSMSWISGETYYILVDPEGTGAYDYTFQLLCPNPDPVNASDCEDAVSVCTDLNFTIAPSGFGNIDELCTNCITNPDTNPASSNSGCLFDGELNSTWMVINIESTGNLEFELGDGIGSNCYDWIMWPYDENTCDNIIANNLPPVRCNWNVPCDSYTGIGPVPSGGYAGNFEPSLPVNAGEQYLLLLSNWSSAETDVPLNFTGSASVNCILLPVELLFFDGEPYNEYSILNWETGAEINNSHFEIERSYNGVDFVKVGEVQGQGTVTHASSYSYTDKKPQQGVNYYRLKQVDFDGKSEYSEIISVLHKGSKFFDLLKLYPNPGTDAVNLEMLLTESSYLNFTVMDQFGRRIISFNQMVSSGVSTVEFDVSRLASGIYSVQVASRDGVHRETIKLVVKNKN